MLYCDNRADDGLENTGDCGDDSIDTPTDGRNDGTL
jgi:hypothetical protein